MCIQLKGKWYDTRGQKPNDKYCYEKPNDKYELCRLSISMSYADSVSTMSIINEITSGMTCQMRITTYILDVQQLLTSINKDTAQWIVHDATKQIISTYEKLG